MEEDISDDLTPAEKARHAQRFAQRQLSQVLSLADLGLERRPSQAEEVLDKSLEFGGRFIDSDGLSFNKGTRTQVRSRARPAITPHSRHPSLGHVRVRAVGRVGLAIGDGRDARARARGLLLAGREAP